MNPRQKVLFSQLQIASVGILIAGFGFVWKEHLLALFGCLVFGCGLIRLVILLRFLKADPADGQDAPEKPGDAPVDVNPWLWDDDEKKQEEEDEWEAAIEAYMRRAHPERFASSSPAVSESSSVSDRASDQTDAPQTETGSPEQNHSGPDDSAVSCPELSSSFEADQDSSRLKQRSQNE